MRNEEEFVARAMVQYLGGPCVVSTTDGEDPPDPYLSFSTSRIALEVTRFPQFSCGLDGTLDNRETQDSFGIKLIENLNKEIGPLLPLDTHFSIGLSLPVKNVAKFRREVTNFVKRVAQNPKMNSYEEIEIDGAEVSILIIPLKPNAEKIAGCVSN